MLFDPDLKIDLLYSPCCWLTTCFAVVAIARTYIFLPKTSKGYNLNVEKMTTYEAQEVNGLKK